jgi:CDP-glucose 4,6-dehydratase
LEASKGLLNLKATLIITTDKVYKNHNHLHGYVESDELGGADPYSASKAAADIATQSWAKSFANTPVAIARAGNVIGGGDWATDRIIPDLVNAYSSNHIPTLRYPHAIRPWQHVLDCLNGYLMLIDSMIRDGVSGEWNFGPDIAERRTVLELVVNFASAWGLSEGNSPWQPTHELSPHEAEVLLLDSSKSRSNLDWKDKLNFDQSIQMTVDWYKDVHLKDPLAVTQSQIRDFLAII